MKEFEHIAKQAYIAPSMPEGHEMRFIAKLNKRHKYIQLSKIVGTVTSVAAVIVIALFTFVPTQEELILKQRKELLEANAHNIENIQNDILQLASERLSDEELIKLKADLEYMHIEYQKLINLPLDMSEQEFIFNSNKHIRSNIRTCKLITKTIRK